MYFSCSRFSLRNGLCPDGDGGCRLVRPLVSALAAHGLRVDPPVRMRLLPASEAGVLRYDDPEDRLPIVLPTRFQSDKLEDCQTDLIIICRGAEELLQRLLLVLPTEIVVPQGQDQAKQVLLSGVPRIWRADAIARSQWRRRTKFYLRVHISS